MDLHNAGLWIAGGGVTWAAVGAIRDCFRKEDALEKLIRIGIRNIQVCVLNVCIALVYVLMAIYHLNK